MALSVETVNKALASFRGYAQYAIGIGTGVGLIKAADGTNISQALGQIVEGLTQVIHGGQSLWIALLPVGSVALAMWSSWTSHTNQQAAAVNAAIKDPNTEVSLEAKASLLDATTSMQEIKHDETKIVVADKRLASAVPASNVVSSH